MFSDALETPLSTGEEAALTCRASKGDTPMRLRWRFEGRPVAGDAGVQVFSVGRRTSVLSIQAVAAGHSGLYTCTAANAAGEARHSARLIVKGWSQDMYHRSNSV